MATNQCSSSNNASVETPESSTLELNVKTLESQTYAFKVNKNETVSVFKEKIAGETGVPVAQQRLIFRGRVLKDDHPLSEYHLENGHTLHLVVRQPAGSTPSSGTPSEGATANDGNGTNGGPSRGRGHISHSVVLGSFNSADQTEGFVPDINRVIGAVLNSFGVGGQNPPVNSMNVTQPSMASNLPGNSPPGNASAGTPATDGQSQTAGQALPRPAFTSATFRTSMPHVVQIPITAATPIPIPTFLTPIPDSLDTILEFINRMEQALSRNGDQPDTSSATSEGRPREELPRNRHGPSTPEALAIVLRNSQRLLSGPAVSSLSHIAGRLEQDGSSSDPALRSQIQSEAIHAGLAMQHLGALLLELGRTLLTLRMAQSQELSYVNAGPAVYISPSGPNPIMVQPFPNQISPLFTGAAGSSNPVTGPGGLGTPPRHINIHIHAGSSASPTMSSAGNHQSSGQQGEPNSNTSSVRVLPTRNISAASAPAHSTGENVSAGIQSGVSSAMTEQGTNTVATSAPEERSSLPDLPSERSNSIGERGKEHCEDLGHPEVDTTGDTKLNKKATPEVVTPLGLGLGGLDRKKRSKQPKTSGKNEDGGTSSASVEGVQQSSGNSSQQLLQSLLSGSSRGRGSDDGVDVSSAMSQVLESPVLDGLLSGVSQQAGVDSPNMLRNMLQQFTQNPQIMNTVQQIAQQVDGQEIENMMSGGAHGEGGGGFDLSRMVQQMMPLVSRAFTQGGPSFGPPLQQAVQANVQPMMQMIEHSDPPEDVFRAMVENAAMSQEDLADVLCSDEALAHEYAELLRRDLEGRLQDNHGP
ncbi:Ubiquitin-like superfamily protein [Raphanus sativus]|uniref:Ubiquitin-like domain-containing protein CIP73 n=1 Tax=Raphanus sativus TaxID=3726 RepID=A0A6J0LBF8_RAPSA|nr:ubiquitin-like domain-containing protein CIP73 [Raphanus sativus]XP_056850477.1 ubiquitin-like domain-containing protein CIP73 [Raphanus sativus]KAJ4878320.1 Ubiquitin-like superfamily protein [Raphanus sativus]